MTFLHRWSEWEWTPHHLTSRHRLEYTNCSPTMTCTSWRIWIFLNQCRQNSEWSSYQWNWLEAPADPFELSPLSKILFIDVFIYTIFHFNFRRNVKFYKKKKYFKIFYTKVPLPNILPNKNRSCTSSIYSNQDCF